MLKTNYLFLIFCLFTSSFAKAQTIDICPEHEPKYLYINGMYNERREALQNRQEISDKTGKVFELVYNRYDGFLVDLWEVFRLKLAEKTPPADFSFGGFFETLLEGPLAGLVADKPTIMQDAAKKAYLDAHSQFVAKTQSSTYSDEPLLLMESQFKQLVKPGQLAWVIAHSQGNLYFPWLKERLVNQAGYDPAYLYTLGLANPAANTYSPYFNDKKDVVLKVLSGFFPVLTAHFDNHESTFPYHDFQNTYLYGEVLDTLQTVIQKEADNLIYLSKNKEAASYQSKSTTIYGPSIYVNHQEVVSSISYDMQQRWKMFCGEALPGTYLIGASDTHISPPQLSTTATVDWIFSVNQTPQKAGQFTIQANTNEPKEGINILGLEIKQQGYQRSVTFLPN